MQRSKGQRGERELFALLSAELGFVVKRNVDQAREGGADCIEIPGWAVECKRCETLSINEWWRQAISQARTNNVKPILFYRQSRKAWRAVVYIHDLVESMTGIDELGSAHTVDMPFDTACFIIRESLA